MALVDRDAGKLRVKSELVAFPTSIDRLPESRDEVLSPNRLARLTCVFREATSESTMTPGPMDFRGALGAAWFETGGYWFWRRFRIAVDAAEASSVVEEEDTVEDVLACLLEVLGRRKIDPERPIRFGGGIFPRLGPLLFAIAGLSGSFFSIRSLDSSMLPSPVGEGNCVSLNSVEADSILVCKSSKLTEGRKSKDPVDCAV